MSCTGCECCAQAATMRVEIAQLTESGVAMVDRWDEECKAHARARHERDALREEVANLTAECSNLAHGEAMLKEQYDGIYAAYQSAVAALQECGATIYASTDSYEELWRRAEIARAATDSAAAGDYVRKLERLIEIMCPPGCSHDGGCSDRYAEYRKLIAAVDARRGGDDDQSGPLRSVAELIAATENPPPVPPEIWRRGGK